VSKCHRGSSSRTFSQSFPIKEKLLPKRFRRFDERVQVTDSQKSKCRRLSLSQSSSGSLIQVGSPTSLATHPPQDACCCCSSFSCPFSCRLLFFFYLSSNLDPSSLQEIFKRNPSSASKTPVARPAHKLPQTASSYHLLFGLFNPFSYALDAASYVYFQLRRRNAKDNSDKN